jgi:hypothetical protein
LAQQFDLSAELAGGHGLGTPNRYSSCVLAQQPELPHRHEACDGGKVGIGDRAFILVGLDEISPLRLHLAAHLTVRYARIKVPWVDRKFIRQVAGAGLIEIEEYSLALPFGVCRDEVVLTVRVAMTQHAAQFT